MKREQYPGAGHQAGGSQGTEDDRLDALNSALWEEPELAPVLEAVAASLDEATLPAGGWEALRAKLQASEASEGESRQRDASEASGRVPKETAASAENEATVTGVSPTARRPSIERPGKADDSPVRRSSAARSRSRPPWGATGWVVGLVLVAAVVTAGSWGALKAGEAAKLRDDQRILAYWMANPDMQLVALDSPGAAAPGNARLGVLCVLPDGRALLLQPSRAPRGATYVVTGEGPSGTQELARGPGNMLQFDASDVSAVAVVLARGDETELVARVHIN